MLVIVRTGNGISFEHPLCLNVSIAGTARAGLKRCPVIFCLSHVLEKPTVTGWLLGELLTILTDAIMSYSSFCSSFQDFAMFNQLKFPQCVSQRPWFFKPGLCWIPGFMMRYDVIYQQLQP